jgi:REP element-mobilizing transposase RayT
VPESGHAILPPQSPASAKGLHAAFHHLCDKVPVDIAAVSSGLALSSCSHDHRNRYELFVALVMPDHVHLILTPLIDEQRQEVLSLVRIMQSIKGASARAINQRLSRNGPVWQEESFDHVLRSSKGLDAKVDYVLQNPVRQGLVSDWREYRWAWHRQDLPVAEMRIPTR